MRRRDAALLAALGVVLAINVVVIVMLHARADGAPAQPVLERPIGRDPTPAGAALPTVKVLVLEDAQACPDCFDISRYVEDLESLLAMEVEAADPAPFGLARLPAIAFNQTIEQYPERYTAGLDAYWSRITIAQGPHAGTWYVLPTLDPPYLDTVRGEVRGRVNVTYLGIASCEECYDVHLLRGWLAERSLVATHERDVDASSAQGKALIARYGITALPTIVLEGDAEAYPALMRSWDTMGSEEEDGAFVLRSLERLTVTYYDLTQEKVMLP